MTRWCRIAVTLIMSLTGLQASADPRVTLLHFDDLAQWEADDHGAALAAFIETCGDMRGPDWPGLCDVARTTGDARSFFELFFRPVLIETGGPALFTGYFEPELRGARRPWPGYDHPIYAVPDDLPDGASWYTRTEIEDGALEDRGLELAWLTNPVDLYFLQIQGSGRIRLSDGSLMRVGYGGSNGHAYSSVGAELVSRGIYEPHQVSADVIRNWVRRNPEAGRDLLRTNDSYVFFRDVSEVPPDRGPLGAMNRSITPMRTIAVDPSHVPLGAPVWIETRGAESSALDRLMIAQDTGSAIKGAQRADIFVGTGPEAGRRAGRIKDPGRMVVLLPIQAAHAMATAAQATGSADG